VQSDDQDRVDVVQVVGRVENTSKAPLPQMGECLSLALFLESALPRKTENGAQEKVRLGRVCAGVVEAGKK
jgi:hypothetical protein